MAFIARLRHVPLWQTAEEPYIPTSSLTALRCSLSSRLRFGGWLAQINGVLRKLFSLFTQTEWAAGKDEPGESAGSIHHRALSRGHPVDYVDQPSHRDTAALEIRAHTVSFVTQLIDLPSKHDS